LRFKLVTRGLTPASRSRAREGYNCAPQRPTFQQNCWKVHWIGRNALSNEPISVLPYCFGYSRAAAATSFITGNPLLSAVLERQKYCPDAIGFKIVNGDTPPTRFSKSLDLFPPFCISKVFSRPATLYLILKNDAECPFFKPPFDVFGKPFKTPIPSKVINCPHFLVPDLGRIASA